MVKRNGEVEMDTMDNDKYGVKKRQKKLLDMLKELDAFFSQNGIKYSLCAGTLLGAVRHNGFIPWDDDIDIMVDRENYTKIINLFKENNDTKFSLNRILWIYRIQGKDDKTNGLKTETIDIFVFDTVPDNALLRKFKLFAMKTMQGMLKTDIDYSNVSVFYKICLWGTHILGKLFTYNFKFKMYDKLARLGNDKEGRYLGSYFSPFKNLKLLYSKTLMDNIIMHEFEDTVMPIVAEYDSYLVAQYGDYMTPPKESDRVSEHM